MYGNGGSKISDNYLLSWLRYGLAGGMGRVERADSVVLHTYAPPMTAPEINIEICCEHYLVGVELGKREVRGLPLSPCDRATGDLV